SSCSLLGVRGRWPAQQKALDLACFRLGQLRHELDLPRVLVPADAGLHDLDDLLGEAAIGPTSGLEHHEGGDDLSPPRVGPAHHRRLGDGWVAENGALDLEGADPVARALDDVVRAAFEPEVAVAIAPAQIADGQPPAPMRLAPPRLVAPIADGVE